jgi:hypothetical protein
MGLALFARQLRFLDSNSRLIDKAFDTFGMLPAERPRFEAEQPCDIRSRATGRLFAGFCPRTRRAFHVPD